jgi:hypothetical protein
MPISSSTIDGERAIMPHINVSFNLDLCGCRNPTSCSKITKHGTVRSYSAFDRMGLGSQSFRSPYI